MCQYWSYQIYSVKAYKKKINIFVVQFTYCFMFLSCMYKATKKGQKFSRINVRVLRNYYQNQFLNECNVLERIKIKSWNQGVLLWYGGELTF